MANFSSQSIPLAGRQVTMTAATGGGDNFAVGPNTFLLAQTAGTAITITFLVPGTDDLSGIAKPDRTFLTPATGLSTIFLDPRYADPADGLCHVTYSAVTALTVACVTGPAN